MRMASGSEVDPWLQPVDVAADRRWTDLVPGTDEAWLAAERRTVAIGARRSWRVAGTGGPIPLQGRQKPGYPQELNFA